MKIEYDNKSINTEVIGGFKINEKEYAVCSYDDGDANYKIVIVEVFREGDKIVTKNIPNEDMDLVLKTYKEIEDKLLGGDNNG